MCKGLRNFPDLCVVVAPALQWPNKSGAESIGFERGLTAAENDIDVILRNPRTASAFSWNSKERQLSLILSEQRQSSCRYRGHACSK